MNDGRVVPDANNDVPCASLEVPGCRANPKFFYSCEDPPYNFSKAECQFGSLVSCFHEQAPIVGTGRWVYILFQGVCLGLVLDVVCAGIFIHMSQTFVDWENPRWEGHAERNKIRWTFLWVWVSYFEWFLCLGLVYAPYGPSNESLPPNTPPDEHCMLE